MNRRLVWCAVGGALSALLFWAVAHASEPPFIDFGAILWVGDSLSDIVHDSEGGQMPSREEFDRRPTIEPPSSVGPVPALPHVVVFMGWSADGSYLGGKTFDTSEDCEAMREQDRVKYPLLAFSACTEIRAERETL